MTKYRFDRDDWHIWIPVTPDNDVWEFDVPDDVMRRYVKAYAELKSVEFDLTHAISDQPGYKP